MPSSQSLFWTSLGCPVAGVMLAATLLAVPAAATGQTPSAVRVLRAAAVLADPQGTAAVVATVNPGELLEVLDERNGWYLVRPRAGATWMAGWVNGANVEAVSAAVITAPTPGAPSTEVRTPPTTRKGFIIGLGGGGAWYREPTFLGPNYTSAIVTDFSIGYAPTSQVLVYYNNQVGWIATDNAEANIVGVTGVGVTYMLRPTARSAFVRGSIGGGIIADVDFDSGAVESNDAGLGMTVSAGYEFARRWSVEGGAMFVRRPDAATHTLLKITVNWMFY